METDAYIFVEVNTRSQTPIGRLKSMVFGFLAMIVIGMAFVTWTELSQSASEANVSVHFLTVYCATVCLILIYPTYLMLVKVRDKEGYFNLKEMFRDHLSVFTQKKDFQPVMTVAKVTSFVCVWVISLYAYVRALTLVPATDVTVLYAVHSCYLYLFGWIILHTHFIAIRIVAMIFGMTGTILMIYKDGFGTNTMWGSILVPVAASGMAGFKVLFVRVVGRVTTGQFSLFLSTLGFYALLLMSPILAALCVTGTETCTVERWRYVAGASGSHIVFFLFSIYGVLRTHQVFISLGLVFSIPLCAVADILWKSFTFSGAETASAILIVIGFILNLLPKNWHQTVQGFMDFHTKTKKPESLSTMERRRRSRSVHYLQA